MCSVRLDCESSVRFLIQNMFSSTRRVTQERQVNKDLQEWQVKEWVLLMNEIVCGVVGLEGIFGNLKKNM